MVETGQFRKRLETKDKIEFGGQQAVRWHRHEDWEAQCRAGPHNEKQKHAGASTAMAPGVEHIIQGGRMVAIKETGGERPASGCMNASEVCADCHCGTTAQLYQQATRADSRLRLGFHLCGGGRNRCKLVLRSSSQLQPTELHGVRLASPEGLRRHETKPMQMQSQSYAAALAVAMGIAVMKCACRRGHIWKRKGSASSVGTYNLRQ